MKATIYKYLDEKGALATIENNSVILKTPLEYNDPFDCIASTSKEEINKAFDLFVNYKLFEYLYEKFIKQNKKATRNKLLAKIDIANISNEALSISENRIYKKQLYLEPLTALSYVYLNKKKSELRVEFKNEMHKAFEKVRSEVVVSCFGSSNDSILMWSHYSNMHRGACLEFEIDDNDFKRIAYKSEIPNFQLYKAFEVILAHEFLGKEVDNANEKYCFITEPLLTKSIDWKYEQEIRCIYSKKKRNPKITEMLDENDEKTKLFLSMPTIKNIYIGCKAEKEFIQKIKRISGDIPVIRMKMKDDEYGVEPESSNDNKTKS